MTLALDLGGTVCKAALVTGGFRIGEYREAPSRGKEGGGALLESALALARGYSGFERVGISVTGQVDFRSGRIIFANDNVPGFTGANVKAFFERELGVPVAVENDVNAAALGEVKAGRSPRGKSMLYVAYGTGIGGAILLNGELYRGAFGSAGEVGHIITHAGGRPCACGMAGCYERYASTGALVELSRRTHPLLDNGRALFAEYDRGNDAIAAAVDEWICEVAYGLVSLVHFFQPHAVILGGGVMERDDLVGRIRLKMRALSMPAYRSTQYVRAKFGNKAPLLGAAYLAGRL